MDKRYSFVLQKPSCCIAHRTCRERSNNCHTLSRLTEYHIEGTVSAVVFCTLIGWALEQFCLRCGVGLITYNHVLPISRRCQIKLCKLFHALSCLHKAMRCCWSWFSWRTVKTHPQSFQPTNMFLDHQPFITCTTVLDSYFSSTNLPEETGLPQLSCGPQWDNVVEATRLWL